VPWNIRVTPKAVNASKGNRWYPDQTELTLATPDPLQFELW
jgi:hypothetical protein